MAYAEYDFYQSVYGGTKLDATEFARLSERGGQYLEALTFGRCGESLSETLQKAVAMAFCAVLEEMQAMEQTDGLTSETVGEWSRSYRGESPEQRIAAAGRRYLRGTGLLWRGWVRSEPEKEDE